MPEPHLTELPPNSIRLGGPPERPNIYEIVPQRHTRIWRKLPEVLGNLNQADDSAFAAVRASIAADAYRVLKVFIPDLMDEHVFDGYPDAESHQKMKEHWREVGKAREAHQAEVLALAEKHREAIEAGDPLPDVEVPEFIEPEWEDPYVEERDFAPTQPEIRQAIQTALKVNDLDLLKYIKDVVGPDFLKKMVRGQLVKGIDGLIEMSSSPSGTSQLLPSLSGEPTSTNGSAQNPTPEDATRPPDLDGDMLEWAAASEGGPSPELSDSPKQPDAAA